MHIYIYIYVSVKGRKYFPTASYSLVTTVIISIIVMCSGTSSISISSIVILMFCSSDLNGV